MLVLGKFSLPKAAPQPAGVLRVLLSSGGGSLDRRLKYKLSDVFFRQVNLSLRRRKMNVWICHLLNQVLLSQKSAVGA